MRTALSNVLCVAGVVGVIYGIARLSAAAAFIAAGAAALIAAANLSRGSSA